MAKFCKFCNLKIWYFEPHNKDKTHHIRCSKLDIQRQRAENLKALGEHKTFGRNKKKVVNVLNQSQSQSQE
jgi:hypothetical protein